MQVYSEPKSFSLYQPKPTHSHLYNNMNNINYNTSLYNNNMNNNMNNIDYNQSIKKYTPSSTPTNNSYIQRQQYLNQSHSQVQVVPHVQPQQQLSNNTYKNLTINTNEPYMMPMMTMSPIRNDIHQKRKYIETPSNVESVSYVNSPSNSSISSCDRSMNIVVESEVNRLKKNAREKQRRNEIKDNFDELCAALELNPRSEKYTIITEAIVQVRMYKKKLAEAEAEIESLKNNQGENNRNN